MGKHKEHIQVCHVCGDIGFYHLLVCCSECNHFAIHRYCLGIRPGSEDDTDVVYWVCENCCPSMETSPYQILHVEEPKPVQSLQPISMETSPYEVLHVEEPEPVQSLQPISECPVLSLVECPEAISHDFVLIASLSGEITIHETWDFSQGAHDQYLIELNCAREGDGLAKDEEDEQGYSIEDTIELDFGDGDEMTLGSPNETVELDIGTDEENDVCYPETKLDEHEGSYSDYAVAVSEMEMEDQVCQGIRASATEVRYQSSSTANQQKIRSDNESQASTGTFNNRTRDTIFLKPIKILETSETDESSDAMSIPSSVLDMANELLEATLESIDVQVGPYKIRSDLAQILQNVLEKYGDIFHDSAVEPGIFLVTVCNAIQYLQHIPFTSLQQKHVNFVRDTLKLPEACGVDVEWLNKHCDYLEKVGHQTKHYLALKQEWDQTVTNTQLKNDTMIVIGDHSTESEANHMEILEHAMNSVKSLWRRMAGKSLADGLF